MPDVFGDCTLANAIIDRLVHHSQIIKITGQSYRIKGKQLFDDSEQSELFTEVMKLNTKYRQVLHLFYYENYKVKEIAEILNISQTSVTTRLERGRFQLRKRLEEVWQNE